MINVNRIHVPGAPQIAGLSFRGFRGEGDYPHMLKVTLESSKADQVDCADSVEDIALAFKHLRNCDPYQDMLFAEMDGQVIGYHQVCWDQQGDGTYLYMLSSHLLPEWRRKGIGRAMLHHAEARLRQIAANHPDDQAHLFQCEVCDTQVGAQALLEREGYRAVRQELNMLRPLSEPVELTQLPEGLEVRPVEEADVRSVLEASNEAFRDHWGYIPLSEEHIQHWMADPDFDPSLWKVAWEGDQVAGMVLNQILIAENEKYGRKRGYTEGISVRRPWRRRGLARALLTRSLAMFKDMGFEEAALSVDTQNLDGALILYTSVGFKLDRHYSIYQKPMA